MLYCPTQILSFKLKNFNKSCGLQILNFKATVKSYIIYTQVVFKTV